jgi:2-polyprenyl-3-methyl-5-hydroxy-6-metoxy-1,4-benzoquinol methylase
MLLQIERVSWRLAYEPAGRRYGEAFHSGLALGPVTLARWVPEGARVLDIGCGTGLHARMLVNRVGTYLGIDNQEAAITTAAGRIHAPQVAFRVGDARALPSGEFDVVLLAHVLEHIDEPEALLWEVARLAPCVIVEVPDFEKDILNRVRLDLGVDFSSDDDHVREYTEELLDAQLSATGWSVQEPHA